MTDNKDTIHYVTSLGAVSGFLLFTIRNQLGLQQNEIAKIFDIAQATYGNMERGEAAINVDFIYMLCSIADIKFSDYFNLIDDILNELEEAQSFIEDNKVKVSLIPSTDFQKILTDSDAIYNLASIAHGNSNILTGQDFYLFLSKETVIKTRRLTTKIYDKDDIKKAMKTTVSELKEIEDKFIINEADDKKNHSGILAMATVEVSTTSLGVFLGLYNPLLSSFGLAGYSLYKAHKMTKEAKKSKKV